MKTTNYYSTFIEIAEDCPAEAAERDRGKTAVRIQYEMISNHPYTYTSDDVLFNVFAVKHDLSPKQKPGAQETFFSKGRACLRSSALGKLYGWGIHFDADGKTALYAMESDEYTRLANDKNLKHLKAMRSGGGK